MASRQARLRMAMLAPSIVVASVLAACGGANDGGSEGLFGTLTVGNSVFGAGALDANGFVVTLNGAPQSPVATVNVGQLWVLPTGTYSVGLTDLAANCVIDMNNGASTGPNPQPAIITTGDTSLVWFAVRCD